MKFFVVFLLCFLTFTATGQTTFQFAEKDGQRLFLDVWKAEKADAEKPLLVYVFGGGFIKGERNDEKFKPFIEKFNSLGFNVVCIDYRLGLKNTGQPGVLNFKPLLNAVKMAVDDLVSAVDFLKANEDKTGVSAQKVVTVGSSAGAITVLQADYELSNGFVEKDWKFDGVVAFAGAVFSKNGRIRYRKTPPAPTMFLHGTADKVVPYKQINLLKWHFAGTKKLAQKFENKDYPYFVYRYGGLGHEVNFFVERNLTDVCAFVQKYVIEKQKLKSDFTLYDPSIKVESVRSQKDLYKNN